MSMELNSIARAQGELGGISRQTVYNLIAEGRLKRVNLGRRAFITGASIEELKASLTSASV